MNFNTIPEALQDLKQGKIILVTDDPDRENEMCIRDSFKTRPLLSLRLCI